jgi:hypothetical protein
MLLQLLGGISQVDIESEVACAGTVVAALGLAMLLAKHILLVPGIFLPEHWGVGCGDFAVELVTLLFLALVDFVHSDSFGGGRAKAQRL